jgi:hypothetical protein
VLMRWCVGVLVCSDFKTKAPKDGMLMCIRCVSVLVC